MRSAEVLVIGGGPAGLAAGLAAAEAGASVTLVERNEFLGGQLGKQTHRFFGAYAEYAGVRGFRIGERLRAEVAACPKIEIMAPATALGYYHDGVVTVLAEGRMIKIKAGAVVVATGAQERHLPFVNNDLPGIYGAGAVQTLMNVHGIVPARRVLMVGAGNIGLIVSYQLRQAGVGVALIVEAAPTIGGYLVHASKVRRLGVPILTRTTVKAAYGRTQVEKAVICRLNKEWREIPGSECELEVDAICLAVGLSPLVELLWQARAAMVYVPELGGHVPRRDDKMETTVPGLYVAGDAAGVEEATVALFEGELAGLNAAAAQGRGGPRTAGRREQIMASLERLRDGPFGKTIRLGLAGTRRGA